MSTPTSNISGSICLCGKKRMSLNLTNWNRHLSSCAVNKLKTKKICSDVSSFFVNSMNLCRRLKILSKKVCTVFNLLLLHFIIFYNILFCTVVGFTQWY